MITCNINLDLRCGDLLIAEDVPAIVSFGDNFEITDVSILRTVLCWRDGHRSTREIKESLIDRDDDVALALLSDAAPKIVQAQHDLRRQHGAFDSFAPSAA